MIRMILPSGFLSFFRSVTAVISALLVLIVGSNETNVPNPDGAEIISKTTYTLLDADVTTQGITNDGEYFYFSGKEMLGKADMKTGKMVRMNRDAIPEKLKDLGCNHIGGLSISGKYIYAAVEDGPDYLNPYIVLYNAKTLEYTGIYYELPQNLHTEGVPWCAVDVENSCVYTAEWSNAKVINIFNLYDMSLIGTLPLSEPVDRIQGAELYDGKLYMSCDEENDQKRILSVDMKTGLVETVFARNIGRQFEAEDVTVSEDENGIVFHVLDRGESRKTVYLTSYRLTK